MDNRERFMRTFTFNNPNRPLFWEFNGWWPETVNRWRAQGLPPNVNPWDYFGFDKSFERVPIDLGPIPCHFPRLLKEDERYRIDMTPWGVVTKSIKAESFIPTLGGSYSGMPSYIDFPVKTRDDWEEYKARFNPYDPQRYPKYLWDEIVDYYNNITDRPVCLGEIKFFGLLRTYLMGYKNLMIALFRDPDWIHEMMSFFADFYTKAIEKVVREVKVDCANFWEDMAYKTGPHISPKMFRGFVLPNYKKVTSFLKDHGVKICYVDSDGDNRLLIPLFIEGGINVIEPCEAQANMDVVTLREQYGKKLAFIGGIDKKTMIAGGRRLHEEVERKILVMMEGGYVPSCDHIVPPDVPLKHYNEYINLLKKYIFA